MERGDARPDSKGLEDHQHTVGIRHCSVQGTSEVLFGGNKELDFRGDRVLLRDEIREGSRQ